MARASRASMPGAIAQHERVGDARKTFLADHQVEAERGEIVGERLHRLRPLEIEDLGVAVAALAAFGAQVGGAGDLAERDLVGAAAMDAAHPHVAPPGGAERALEMTVAELGAAGLD